MESCEAVRSQKISSLNYICGGRTMVLEIRVVLQVIHTVPSRQYLFSSASTYGESSTCTTGVHLYWVQVFRSSVLQYSSAPVPTSNILLETSTTRTYWSLCILCIIHLSFHARTPIWTMCVQYLLANPPSQAHTRWIGREFSQLHCCQHILLISTMQLQNIPDSSVWKSTQESQ